MEEKQKLANLNEAQSSQIYDASALILEVLSSEANEGTITDVSQLTKLREAISEGKLVIVGFPEESPTPIEAELDGTRIYIDVLGLCRMTLYIDSRRFKYLTMYQYKEKESIRIEQSENILLYDGCYIDYGSRTYLKITYANLSDKAEEYNAEFVSGDKPTILEYPTELKWYGGVPVIKPNKRYFVHVIRYFAWLYEFDV